MKNLFMEFDREMEISIKGIYPLDLGVINKNFSLYIDLTGIYENLIRLFSLEKNVSPFKESIFKEVVKCFLKSLIFIDNKKARFTKAFHISREFNLDKDLKNFILNLGIISIEPTTLFTKNYRSALDLELSLEIVNDNLRNNSIESFILVSGNFNFYPIVRWIKESTDKNVYVLLFKKFSEYNCDLVCNNTLLEVDNLDSLFKLVKKCFNELTNQLFENNFCIFYFSDKSVPVSDILDDDINWLRQNVGKILEINTEFNEKFIHFEEKIKIYRKFVKHLIQSIEKWFEKNNSIHTEKIISEFIPKWNLEISEDEARFCLKQLKPYLTNELNYKFKGIENENSLEGEFFKQ